jgi:hypothetical protein
MDERDSQAALMAKKRAKQRDLVIPPPKNLDRRNRSLSDVQFFLSTYFSDLFDEEFTSDRADMLESIIQAAKYGGDQAIAGPRGEGKTTLAMCGAIYLMFAGLSGFPVVVGKSQTKSQAELKDMVERLQQSELLIYDFPEIGIPFQKVGGWSSRARMQTIGGKSTNITIKPDLFSFPRITAEQMGWPDHIKPVSNGQIMAAVGIDGPVRGTKHKGRRPTLAIIDDIEDREAAASDAIIAKNEEIIEQDIAGMGRSAKRLPRVFLCTIQNRKCIAYKYTDPKVKPSFRGKRYRKMIKPPDRMDLVEQYIEMRQGRKDSDPDAREAFAFWRDNKETIEAGSIVSNPRSFNGDMHADGEPIELSACHSYYNRVADVGQKAVSTEIDNDPPETVGPQGQGVTAELVANRLSGLARRQVPASTMALTAAIDLGKYRCHWVVVAWWPGGGGCVVDYGVAEVTGTDKSIDNEASEPMIYRALLNWRDELMGKLFTDQTGTNRRIDFCLVDSGTFTTAAYEFCRQAGGVFHPSKGINPYYPRKTSTATCLASANLHAQKFTAENVWLYELDTNHWKKFVHERFLTPPMDENNMLRRGSLSLFELDGYEKHGSYSQHIAAEELLTEFKEGKGVKTYWNVKNENNHWLDATYMAAAGSEVCGIKLIGGPETAVEPRHVDVDAPKPRKQVNPRQHGNSRFRSRPGGWVPKRR